MGKFSEKVRRGKVPGPRRQSFTVEAWRLARDEFTSEDSADLALYISGRHIHSKLEAIRKAIKQSSLSRLSTETQVKALVALANHQFEALQLQLKVRAAEAAGENPSGEVHVRDLAATQVRLADGGSYNADAALGSMLDGIAIPVKVALMGPPRIANDSFADVDWNDVRLEVNLGALYDQAENLWEDCVWNTYIVIGAGNQMLAVPMNVDAKRGTQSAAARRFALGIESTTYAIQAIQQSQALGLMPRMKEVQAVLTDGDHQRIQLGPGKLDPYGPALLLALRTTACPPYYDAILNEPRSLLAGASLSQLFDGWMVVSQAASRLWEVTSPLRRSDKPAEEQPLSDMLEYVPFLTTEALVAAVHEAAGIPVAGAQAIIEFLTFLGKGQQEFWTQPLVTTGDPSKLYPVFGALAAPPNLRFALERWMAQLNVKLEDRGLAFEEHLRTSLVESAATSPMLSQIAKVVPCDYTFRCSDKAFGQIDALFCIGSRVFVLEVKCILEPTESTSIGTHRAAIEHAVEQAKTRVALIEEHRGEFIADMKQFGWDLPQEFCVQPLVAVSTVAHVGVPLDGVPIVDELVLNRFFQGGYEYVGLDTGDFSILECINRAFYSNAAEAQANAALYFEYPPQLKQYSDALQLRKVPMYSVSNDDWSGTMVDFE